MSVLRTTENRYVISDTVVLDNQLRKLNEERGALDAQINSIEPDLKANFGADWISATTQPDFERLLLRIRSETGEEQLTALATRQRDLNAVLAQWRAVSTQIQPVVREDIERQEADSRKALDDWRANTGAKLEAAINELRGYFPDLEPAAVAGPYAALRRAQQLLDIELKRCGALQQRDDQDVKDLESLVAGINQGTARLSNIDRQLGTYAGATEDFARSLASLAPHIHTDECPVCGRNFEEISKAGLREHLDQRIKAITEAANRLRDLTKDRATTSSAIAGAERQRVDIVSRLLSPQQRSELADRKARLDELNVYLKDNESAASEGADLIKRAANTAQRLSELRTSDRAATAMRQTVDQIATTLGLKSLERSESVDGGLARFQTHMDELQQKLLDWQRKMNNLASVLLDFAALKKRRAELLRDIEMASNRRLVLGLKMDEADRRIEQAKALARSARQERTAVVRRVFNEELNAIWRNLFIRLAPDEPFIPAFALPSVSIGPVEAVLETHFGQGQRGGNPRAMLSAGNLNTAALTLFLALHLSVKPVLPWLVIDDPVQSMDEVHISQFAALLRTLSKQKGRQIIVAVHDRALFDYLTLELSPAYQDDRLVTVELSRSIAGDSTATSKIRTFEPDNAIAA